MEWLNWQTVLLAALGIAIGGIFRDAIKWLWVKLIEKIGWKKKSSSSSGPTNIKGKWNTTFKENNIEFHEIVTVNEQEGDKVKGEVELLDRKEPNKITDTYTFEGIFKERILTATYDPTDPADYERGAFVLHYENFQLDGQYIIFRSRDGRRVIMPSSYKWEKMN